MAGMLAGGQGLFIDGLHQRVKGAPLFLLVAHVVESIQAFGDLGSPGEDLLVGHWHARPVASTERPGETVGGATAMVWAS